MTKNPIAKNLNKFNKPSLKESKKRQQEDKEHENIISEARRKPVKTKRRSVDDL